MAALDKLFDGNRDWARKQLTDDPEYFHRLAMQQVPEFMWIGCSDSRVPANQILGMNPGQVFVHRNVANLVHNCDMNCLSALQFAVEALKVKHIIVCGHYGCGGIRAACQHSQHGLLDNWLRNIKDTYAVHSKELDAISDENARIDRVCELNVLRQVHNVCKTSYVQNAWASGVQLAVHGLIYRLQDGLLDDLALHITRPEQIPDIYRTHL